MSTAVPDLREQCIVNGGSCCPLKTTEFLLNQKIANVGTVDQRFTEHRFPL